MTSTQGMQGSSRKSALLLHLSSVLMLTLYVFVFVPFEIYQANIQEFETGFLQILSGSWKAIVLFQLLLLTPLALPPRYARMCAFVLFAFACFAWLQSTLLMWDYGVLDGRGMDFESFQVWGTLDLLILLAIVVCVVCFARQIEPHLAVFASIFIIGQLALIFINSQNLEKVWWREPPRSEMPASLLELSADQNIFHIILDSAQSDVFLELIDEAELRETFRGFSLFFENAAVAPHTAFGVPSTFSGTMFDASESPEQFFRSAMENGVHASLLDAGYRVNIVPALPMRGGPHTNYYEIPSSYRGTYEDLVKSNTARLFDASLFRVSPHFLRIAIYNEGNWFIANLNRSESSVRSFREKKFFSDYIENIEIAGTEAAYHFLHFMPPHPPYVTLADGSYAGQILPANRTNFLNEMRPMVGLVVQLIDRLKSLGLYEKSAMVIQGDHGSNVPPLIDGQVVQPCVPRLPALLAVKRPFAEHPLVVSRSKTTILDIAPTILSFAGRSSGGVFSLDPKVERRRPFSVYQDNQVSNYVIQGSVYDENSCRKIGLQTIENAAQSYVMGSVVNFGVQGNASRITGEGWGPQLTEHSWSKARTATLRLTVPEAYVGSDLRLEIHYRTFLHPDKQPEQRIQVSANGVSVDEWIENKSRSRKRVIPIPASAVSKAELVIVFDFPDAASPKSLGLGADLKKLGIALLTLKLDTATDASGNTPK